MFYSLLFMFTVLPMVATEPVQELAVSVSAQEHAKLKFLIVSVGAQKEVAQLADIIAHDCQWTGQCEVAVRSCESITTKNQMKEFAQQGFPLVLFVSVDSAKNVIDWRLYDTRRVSMICGKQYIKRGAVLRGWAHNIADEVWPLITGHEGIFSTKLAYCKDVERKKNKRRYKHVFIADYDGSNEEVLIATPTINVAPRWNADTAHPLVFYSESTNSNIRLVSANTQGQRRIASNFDGLNMQTTFCKDGTKLVYCASRGNGSCQLYYYSKGEFKKLTNNEGNNVSPSMSADGSKLYFCSDYKTGKPHIYCMNLSQAEIVPIVEQGSCFCPSYCAPRRQVAYCKMVAGMAQVFAYDEVTKEQIQLTFDATSKDECSWSPCGNYLLFAVENKGKSRIAMLNLLTNERRYLTPEGQVCTYPSWSPMYNEFPTVKA